MSKSTRKTRTRQGPMSPPPSPKKKLILDETLAITKQDTKNITNVTRCRDNRSAKSRETR